MLHTMQQYISTSTVQYVTSNFLDCNRNGDQWNQWLAGAQLVRIDRKHSGHRFSPCARARVAEYPTRAAARSLLCEPDALRFARVETFSLKHAEVYILAIRFITYVKYCKGKSVSVSRSRTRRPLLHRRTI